MNREVFEYDGIFYLDEEDVDRAIEEIEAHNFSDEMPQHAYESIWYNEVDKHDKNDFVMYKEWCVQEGIKPSNAESSKRYWK